MPGEEVSILQPAGPVGTSKRRGSAHSQGMTNFISGTAGGVAQVTVGHPFDTLKVRMQTAQTGQYRGAADCLIRTVRLEGLGGLYKGVTSPLLGIGFWSILIRPEVSNAATLITRYMLAGAMAGGVMAFANCPIELLKVRLQVQDPSRPRLYSGIIDCARQTIRSQGVLGLYRGFNATFLRDVPSFAAYFAMYESLKQTFGGSAPSLVVAGGLAGIAAWLPAFPQDVVKSQMQSSSEYRSVIHCARAIYQKHGLGGFFRGFVPTMARAFPANAATFLAYEAIYSLLTK